jgi:hypothetical protein
MPTDSQRADFARKMIAFANAAAALSKSWEHFVRSTDPVIANVGVEAYPFAESFDELLPRIDNWKTITLAKLNVDALSAVARFAPMRAALIARGWHAADISVEHTGGNVYCLTLVVKRERLSRKPVRVVDVGDPSSSDYAYACLMDPDNGDHLLHLDAKIPWEDARAFVEYLTTQLAEHGYRPGDAS